MIVHKNKGCTVYEIPFEFQQIEEAKRGIQKLHDIFRPNHRNGDDFDKLLKQQGSNFNGGPGVQFYLSMSNDDVIINLQKELSKAVLNFHNNTFDRKGDESYQDFWAYISYPENHSSSYHNHSYINPREKHVPTTWTITYYLDIPNNCKGNEGMIGFSLDKTEENAMLLFPKLNSIYIFSGSLPHKAYLNPNSTNSRITIAGNVHIPLVNKSLI